MKESRHKSPADLLENLKEVEFSAPIGIDKIIEILKIQIIHDWTMTDQLSESIFTENESSIRINMNHNSYEARRRFTLAHQLGHYCLHHGSFVDTLKSTNTIDSFCDNIETQANNFAMQILIPAPLITEQCDAYNGDQFLNDMATLFNVPNNIMVERLKRLGIDLDVENNNRFR